MAQKRHLDRFTADQFDLIIVDEFHHAAADELPENHRLFHTTFLARSDGDTRPDGWR
ncbi:hypothetical protein OVA29_19365 [Exiguobacterium sp. SL14]|nr:DEAD/DEAH box helicase family protein [Exiguobacterium sp. SL14]MCY1692431.1 hypothetical protein [Exiguobacterium sp. SL14]